MILGYIFLAVVGICLAFGLTVIGLLLRDDIKNMNTIKCEICESDDNQDNMFQASDGLYYHQVCAEDTMPPHGEVTPKQHREEYQDENPETRKEEDYNI